METYTRHTAVCFHFKYPPLPLPQFVLWGHFSRFQPQSPQTSRLLIHLPSLLPTCCLSSVSQDSRSDLNAHWHHGVHHLIPLLCSSVELPYHFYFHLAEILCLSCNTVFFSFLAIIFLYLSTFARFQLQWWLRHLCQVSVRVAFVNNGKLCYLCTVHYTNS